MPDPREIAGKLTKARREAILTAKRDERGHVSWSKWPRRDVLRDLARADIFTGTFPYRKFTRLGLQVRALLQEDRRDV